MVVIKKKLIACIGNICRSSTAQHLLSEALQSFNSRVTSAGLAACTNRPMVSNARALIEARRLVDNKLFLPGLPDVIERKRAWQEFGIYQ